MPNGYRYGYGYRPPPVSGPAGFARGMMETLPDVLNMLMQMKQRRQEQETAREEREATEATRQKERLQERMWDVGKTLREQQRKDRERQEEREEVWLDLARDLGVNPSEMMRAARAGPTVTGPSGVTGPIQRQTPDFSGEAVSRLFRQAQERQQAPEQPSHKELLQIQGLMLDNEWKTMRNESSGEKRKELDEAAQDNRSAHAYLQRKWSDEYGDQPYLASQDWLSIMKQRTLQENRPEGGLWQLLFGGVGTPPPTTQTEPLSAEDIESIRGMIIDIEGEEAKKEELRGYGFTEAQIKQILPD